MNYNIIKHIILESNKKIFHKSTEPGLSIIKYTNFLNTNTSMTERLKYIQYNIFENVKCPTCNNDSNIDTKSDKFRIKFCSTKCRSNYINETGLTIAQLNGIKGKNTKSQINNVTGLTGYQESALKAAKTMKKLDADNLSTYNKSKNKIKESNLKIDPKTGLTGYQKVGKKNKIIHSKINPENGLTGYQENGIKTKISLRKKWYNNTLNNFNKNFKILTTIDEYSIKSNNIISYQCLKCDMIRESPWPYIRCLNCHPYNTSISEGEVLQFCKSITKSIHNSRQIIKPLELDIYLPDHNLAIEYNGLYYHSSYSIESENRDYHIHKTQECEKQGIQLFHIFENEWQNPQKQLIWKSIIKNQLGKSTRIFARKTEIRSVSSTEKSEFLNSNHLQGDCVSSVNLGLYLGDELVSLMTFGRSRYDKKIDWELIRFCNKIGCSVIGGASKLLKSFRKENSGSIISYADKRRSSGNLYKQLRFELSHESGPNYFYYKDQGLESRLKYQKHKLKYQLDKFDSELTESENMYSNGYRKIYDCGNQVWILN